MFTLGMNECPQLSCGLLDSSDFHLLDWLHVMPVHGRWSDGLCFSANTIGRNKEGLSYLHSPLQPATVASSHLLACSSDLVSILTISLGHVCFQAHHFEPFSSPGLHRPGPLLGLSCLRITVLLKHTALQAK